MRDSGLHENENVYDSLAAALGGEERWAFGTGFDDPLAGVDPTLPPDVDVASISAQCLGLGDDALVMAQRLAGWCSNAPDLEDDVALANIALDLLGQARLLLSRAVQADPSLRPADAPTQVPAEDALAYFRGSSGFRNVVLAELDDEGDFAMAIVRLFIFSTWRLALLGTLTRSPDPVLAAIAVKGATELTYHREYAADWVVRLGDGTEVSHARTQAAFEQVWPYLAELFAGSSDRDELHGETLGVVHQVLTAATLEVPQPPRLVESAPGRGGAHTEKFDDLLADMQGLARAHPEATW